MASTIRPSITARTHTGPTKHDNRQRDHTLDQHDDAVNYGKSTAGGDRQVAADSSAATASACATDGVDNGFVMAAQHFDARSYVHPPGQRYQKARN